jgi:hypothetical protein
VQELEALKWLLHEYGPGILPSVIALLLAWHVARTKNSGALYEDYHDAIVEMTKVMQEMKTLLDERTRRQDERQVRQDKREITQNKQESESSDASK